MKILPVELIREADAYTIKNEPIASIDLMERAAYQCFKWIKKVVRRDAPINIFCGPGNNGGDGLVISRLLIADGYHVVTIILRISNKFSPDFITNLERLEKSKKAVIYNVTTLQDLPDIPDGSIIIDAIFGSGLSKPIEGFAAEVIRLINDTNSTRIAIDIPSGLYADQHSALPKAAIVKADYTLTFQYPKLSFLFAENEHYVGKWIVLPIGLMDEATKDKEIRNFTIDRADAFSLLKSRTQFSHKGHFGHALLIAGSYGKTGAAVLAAQAALRSGAGLVTAHLPASSRQIMQTAAPEVMVSIDNNDRFISHHPDLSLFNTIAIGPGLGLAKETQQTLKLLIQNATVPLLFDADALNILAENKTWISFIPPLSIFTPHPKEFERLFGKFANAFERNKRQIEFSVMHRIYIVLKGAFTSISTPDGKCFFNTTGNPGMATGGSGDVLTGVILGLLAQGYHPQEAAILGVYLHGLAGDIASKDKSQEAMIAGDITENLGAAFKKIRKNK